MNKIKPFSGGTEYLIWRTKNCDECQDDYDWENEPNEGMNIKCEAEGALSLALVSTGLVTKEVADFIGFQKGTCIWLCPNKVERELKWLG